MYRKLASAVLVASALNAKYALALGLGGITMHSALNQPLAAEIPLSSAGDLDKSQILISLASQEDFLRAGVDRSLFLSDIKFDVVLDGKGGGVIKLRSTRRLNEPYLDLLIEAKWPTGRMLRSYTALVDLPVYAEDSATQVNVGHVQQESAVAQPVASSAQPVANAVASTVQSTPARSKTAKSAEPKRPSRVLQPVHLGSEYRIQPNETLSQIAAKLNPGAQFSVNQTMLAIQKLNPHAFVRNNINLIKAGAVLRVPSAADVGQFSASSASREVVEQTRQWRGAQLDATDAVAGEYRQAALKEEGHLSLTSAGSGLASGKDKIADAGAQQQPGLASGDVQASEREKKQLYSQVESLNTEVSKLKRMIELKDQELAALQKNLGKKPDAGSPDIQPVAVAEKSATEMQEQLAERKVEEPAPVAAEPTSGQVDKPLVDQGTPEKPVEKPKAVEKIAPQAEPVAEPGLLEQLKANPLYIGGVALLLIFAVVAFIFRRKAQAESQAMAENDIGNFDFDRAVAHEDVLDNLPSEQELDEFVSAEESAVEAGDGFDEQPSTVMQTSDPIGEADIYIAYGRYDQAAELLLNAISAAPDDVSLRSKLLEVYIESKNRSGFQQQYLELQAMGQAAAISNAKELLTSAGAADWLDNLPVDDVADSFARDIDQSADLLDVDLVEDDIDVYRADHNTDSEFSFDEFESVSKPDPEEENIATVDDGVTDLDLSDLQLSEAGDSGDDFGFADISEPEAVSSEADDDFSLDLSDLDLESTETDIAFGLDDNIEAETVDVESTADELDLSDLSFELPEDFVDEAVAPLEEAVVSADTDLSFDDIDLGFGEEMAVTAEADVSAEAVSDELSFEDFDLGADVEEQVQVTPFAETAEEIVAESDETAALDFADMDFGLEDGSGLVSLPEDVDSYAEMPVGMDLAVDEVVPAEELALESDFEFGEEVVEPASDEPVAFDHAGMVDSSAEMIDQPHVSAPLSTLESEDLEFLTDGDEVSTKLDLAQAYVDLGDVDGARDILLEVMKEGREDQKAEAAALLDSLD